MQAEERKKRIAEITRGNLFSNDGKGKRLRYCGEVKTFVEYEVPIDLLVFNVENGRIASMVKSSLCSAPFTKSRTSPSMVSTSLCGSVSLLLMDRFSTPAALPLVN